MTILTPATMAQLIAASILSYAARSQPSAPKGKAK